MVCPSEDIVTNNFANGPTLVSGQNDEFSLFETVYGGYNSRRSACKQNSVQKLFFLIANVTAAICILTIRVVNGTRFRSFGHEHCACYAQFTRPDSTKLF